MIDQVYIIYLSAFVFAGFYRVVIGIARSFTG